MQFTLNWLRDHLDFDADAHQVAECLLKIGFELEAITDRSVDFGGVLCW